MRATTDPGGPIRLEGAIHPQPAHLSMLQFELAGCPAILGLRVASAAQNGSGIRLHRVFAAGQPALALRLPTLHHLWPQHRLLLDRVTLYVAARTYRPLAVKATLGKLSGSGRIQLSPATASILDRLADDSSQAGGIRNRAAAASRRGGGKRGHDRRP